MAAEHRHRGLRHEALEQHRGHAAQQHHHQVVGPADVRVRERDRAHVGRSRRARRRGRRRPRSASRRCAGRTSARPWCPRSRRSSAPPKRRAAAAGRSEGSPSGSAPSATSVSKRAALRPERARHRGVVEAAEDARHRQPARTRLAQHGADLALAIDREDRVLHRAEPREREREHHRLDARRQLPGERRAGLDAEREEAGRDALAPRAALAEAHSPVAFVEQHRAVRARVRALLEQPPECRIRRDTSRRSPGTPGPSRSPRSSGRRARTRSAPCPRARRCGR